MATIPTLESKEAANRRRPRSSSIVAGGSPRRIILAQQQQQRALAKLNHRRSQRYTRTLDIIIEEQHHESSAELHNGHRNESEKNGNQNNSDRSGSRSEANIATDFWHSMRSMKKSATSVSLESLVSEEQIGNIENQSPNQIYNLPNQVEFEDLDSDEDLEDWDF
jgi:hypothetical protein